MPRGPTAQNERSVRLLLTHTNEELQSGRATACWAVPCIWHVAVLPLRKPKMDRAKKWPSL
jgi:hypothetical protein